MVSLNEDMNTRRGDGEESSSPYVLPYSPITPIFVPDAKDILALAHAQRTAAYFGVCARRFAVATRIPVPAIFCSTIIELVTDDRHHDVLPDTVGNSFFEANDPFTAIDVKGVLPYGTLDPRVEEYEIGGRNKEGRGIQVRPEGPKGFDLSEVSDSSKITY